MAEVRHTSITLTAYNAASSKQRILRRLGYNPKRSTLVDQGDLTVKATEFTTDIETIDTEAGTATITRHAYDDAKDKKWLIHRLGLNPATTAVTLNDDGTVSLAPA